jgi:hypothetical protein
VYYSKVLFSSMSPGEMKFRFETIKYGITRNDSMKSWRDVVQGLLTDRKERTETVGMSSPRHGRRSDDVHM